LNVVLDPVAFEEVDSCTEREEFAALLGDETLAYYERTHPHAGMPFSRCC
jgi:hypothetical protein